MLLSLNYVITKHAIDCGSLNCIITKDTTDIAALNCTITKDATDPRPLNYKNTNVQSQNPCSLPNIFLRNSMSFGCQSNCAPPLWTKHRAHYRSLIDHPRNRRKPSQALRPTPLRPMSMSCHRVTTQLQLIIIIIINAYLCQGLPNGLTYLNTQNYS
jgi:hypothetical protein